MTDTDQVAFLRDAIDAFVGDPDGPLDFEAIGKAVVVTGNALVCRFTRNRTMEEQAKLLEISRQALYRQVDRKKAKIAVLHGKTLLSSGEADKNDSLA